MTDEIIALNKINEADSSIAEYENNLNYYTESLQQLKLQLAALKDVQALNRKINVIEDAIHEFEAILSQYKSDAQLKSSQLDPLKKDLTEQNNQLAEKENEKQKLMVELQGHINVLIHGEHIFDKLHDLSFIQYAKEDKFNTTGLGASTLINESTHSADMQAYSLKVECDQINKEIEVMKAKIKHSEEIALASVKEIEIWLNEEAKVNIENIKRQFDCFQESVNDLEQLKQTYEANNLYGAAARNEAITAGKLLKTFSPNEVDERRRKPIWYAAYFGALEMFMILSECTQLSEQDKNNLLKIFSKDSEDPMNYFLVLSKLKNPQYRYDHLWKKDASIGDNVIALFKDFYSPAIFSGISFMPDELKRILTGHWSRSAQDLKIAEDAVIILSHSQPKEREDLNFCKVIFAGRWQAYFENHGLNSTGELAMRLHYINLKTNWQVNALPAIEPSSFGTLPSISGSPFRLIQPPKPDRRSKSKPLQIEYSPPIPKL